MRRRVVLALMACGFASDALAQDRLFVKPEFPPEIHNQPRWVVAAHCAALFETHDPVMERDREAYRVRMAARGHPVSPLTAEDYARFERMSEGARRSRQQYTQYAMARMNRDRPGQDNARTFEAEVARQRLIHEGLNRTAEQYGVRETSCRGFSATTTWEQEYIRRGWPDRRDSGDAPL